MRMGLEMPNEQSLKDPLPPLHQLILDTWLRLKPEILSNPRELQKRLKRRESRTFSRPPRAWCLAVRASDRDDSDRSENASRSGPSRLRLQ
jgi:hypothetical protein